MAKCGWCEQETGSPDTISCIENTEVEYPDGTTLPSVPFEAEPLMSQEEWMEGWQSFHDDHPDLTQSDSKEDALKRCAEYQKRWDRCGDCNVKDGGFHHPGCDQERCPKCDGQLISCGCLDDEDDDESDEGSDDE